MTLRNSCHLRSSRGGGTGPGAAAPLRSCPCPREKGGQVEPRILPSLLFRGALGCVLGWRGGAGPNRHAVTALAGLPGRAAPASPSPHAGPRQRLRETQPLCRKAALGGCRWDPGFGCPLSQCLLTRLTSARWVPSKIVPHWEFRCRHPARQDPAQVPSRCCCSAHRWASHPPELQGCRRAARGGRQPVGQNLPAQPGDCCAQ